MKAKELTASERYVLRAIKCEKVGWRDDARFRTPYEARRIIRLRKSSWKWEKVVEAFRVLERAFETKDYNDVIEAKWKLSEALKYQGYLQLQVLLAEERIKGLDEKDVEARLLAESL